MNYINRPKPAYTQEERIKYLEKSLRELRIEKDEIRKEKWEYRHKILKLEEENKNLKEELFNIKRDTKYNWLRDTLVVDDSKTAIEQWARKYEAELHNKYVSELEEEVRRLKKENEELQEYKRMYEWLW